MSREHEKFACPPVLKEWQECSGNVCVQYRALVTENEKLVSIKQKVNQTQGMQSHLPLGHVTSDRRLVLHYPR